MCIALYIRDLLKDLIYGVVYCFLKNQENTFFVSAIIIHIDAHLSLDHIIRNSATFL